MPKVMYAITLFDYISPLILVFLKRHPVKQPKACFVSEIFQNLDEENQYWRYQDRYF
jgi:hypothetical protein